MTRAPSALASSSAAMHNKQRFMWAHTRSGSSFDVVLTTLANAHMLHSSTFADAESPLHGFVYKGKFYLDPQGALCEALNESSLSQSPQDGVLETAYEELGLLHRDAAESQACIIAGHTFIGVTSTDAAALSRFLMRKTLRQSMNPKAPVRHVIPRRATEVRVDMGSRFRYGNDFLRAASVRTTVT